MPFAKRSTYTLTLAISSALFSTFASAADVNSKPEMAWNCSMDKGGEWNCTVNEALVKAAEADTAISTSPEQSVSAKAPTETVSVTAAPAAKAAPVTVINKTADIQTVDQAALQQQIASEPVQKAQTTTPVATNTYNYSDEVIGHEWQCGTSATGSWECTQVPVHALASSSSTSRAKGTALTPLYIADNPYADLDWVYYQNPQGQQCRGKYLEPQFPVMGDEHLENPPMFLEAGQSSTVLGGLTQLEGGVNVRQGSRRLQSTSAELDQVTNKALFEGNVSFREPGLLVLSDQAEINTTTSEGIFNDARYVLHEDGFRGAARRIIRLEDERLRFEQGDYTYCPPDSEAWQLDADTIVINKQEGYGEAEDAVLRIAGVPVLYAPYFTFPIDDTRKSGFLYPSFGYSEENGYDISVPYYFNIAPNMDDTLTARLITERGLLLENEFRYMNQWSENSLSTAYIADDDLYNDERWLLGFKHSGAPAERWKTDIDFTAMSDEDYFDDLDTNLEISRQDHLDQRADLTYYGKSWNVRTRLHDYQSVSSSTSPYKILPQITLTGEHNYSDDLAVNYTAEFTRFDRNLTGLTGSNRIVGDRTFLLPSISYDWQQPWGFVKPSLRLWSSHYKLDNQLTGRDENPSITTPILSIDSGLIFERDRTGGGIQTLEPRLFVLYVPEEDQDDIPNFDTSEYSLSYDYLFRYNRFSGKDRIGDAQQLSLGLSSAFYRQNGAEQARLSVGQAYYFSDREVTLSSGAADITTGQSDIATEALWYITPNFRASMDAIFAHSNFKNSESNYRLRYASDLNHQIDLSYRYTDNAREQTDLSFIWPIASHWTAMGRWLYDLQESESNETALGIEYESCCWKVSFAGRRWLDDTDKYDNGIFLNFTLKGLGSFGSGSNDFLTDITGYEEREEYNEN